MEQVRPIIMSTVVLPPIQTVITDIMKIQNNADDISISKLEYLILLKSDGKHTLRNILQLISADYKKITIYELYSELINMRYEGLIDIPETRTTFIMQLKRLYDNGVGLIKKAWADYYRH
jgi:hypothetical protein